MGVEHLLGILYMFAQLLRSCPLVPRCCWIAAGSTLATDSRDHMSNLVMQGCQPAVLIDSGG